MVWAIRFEQFGGPEVLKYQQVDVGEPKAGEARVAHRAIGLNFIDVYHRTGLYPMTLPSGLGGEGAGVVMSVGPGVTHVRPGDRVAYTASGSLGSYAEERVLDARSLVRLPDAIDEKTGAAMMLKGLTAWYLLKRSYTVAAGDWILLHAAAGGVGLIAAQWARELGARVIGVVGSAAKRELALAHGCEHVLLDSEDVPQRVRELAGGGVPVVYDSVGRTTFFQSLDCLRAARVARELRQFVRQSRAVRAARAPEARLVVRHAAHVARLHSRASRPRGRQQRAVRPRAARSRADRGPPDLRIARCGAGAPQSRSTAHYRLHGADPVATHFARNSP